MSIQAPKREVVDEVVDVVADCTDEVRGILRGRRSQRDSENPSGETQLAADVWADRLFERRLGGVDGVGEYASEEREEIVDTGSGPMSVAVDPLDGSSNLESNNAMGTIVALYDAPLPARGETIVGALYVLYGPVTTMLVAVDGEVTEYEVVDGATHEITEDVAVPDDSGTSVYGFGGRVQEWTPEFTGYAREMEQTEGTKLRYGGAMIADVNQVVTYGGVFAYPAVESAPNGKLRLQFEGNPIGYIVECAGGATTNGERSLLDVEPTDLHQRVPLFVGSEEHVERAETLLG